MRESFIHLRLWDLELGLGLRLGLGDLVWGFDLGILEFSEEEEGGRD